MPFQNLLTIAAASIISLACYTKVERQPFVRLLRYSMNLVQSEYVKPVAGRTLYEGAMAGVVSRLDPHSEYVSPSEYSQFRESIDQEFGGLGILVEPKTDTNQILVASPLVGTPAFEAGIRAGDVIVRINEQEVNELPFAKAVQQMRGKPGSLVKLSLARVGEEKPLELELKRRIIEIESVLGDFRAASGEWNYFLEGAPEIAYVRIIQFGEHTAGELRQVLQGLSAPQALILDLRGNPGGLLDSALEICDMFLEEGEIVSVRGRQGLKAQAAHLANAGLDVPAELPLAVLLNRYSASASEIVAACLQDHKRAALVGERSYGKGSVQKLFELEGGAAALKLTTASYWRPTGRNIHRDAKAKESDEWGVSPNAGLAVKLADEEFQRVMEVRRARDIVGPPAPAAKSQPALPEPRPSVPEASTNAPEEITALQAEGNRPDALQADRQLRAAVEYLRGILAASRSE